MAVSEAHKRANAKWDKENLTIVAAKLRKEKAALFKEIAYRNNTTPNELLRSFINKYIEENS